MPSEADQTQAPNSVASVASDTAETASHAYEVDSRGATDERETKSARPVPVAISDLGLKDGDLIEVSWQVEMADGNKEYVWWKAALSVAERGEYTLTYEPRHGFDVDTRRVVFSSQTVLWDADLRDFLDWRCV